MLGNKGCPGGNRVESLLKKDSDKVLCHRHNITFTLLSLLTLLPLPWFPYYLFKSADIKDIKEEKVSSNREKAKVSGARRK